MGHCVWGPLEDLRIYWYQVNQLSDGSCKILCNDDWLEAFKSHRLQQQDENLFHTNLPSPLECRLLLEPSFTQPCPKGLHVLNLHTVHRKGRVRRMRVDKTDYLSPESGLGQLMSFVEYKLCLEEKKGKFLSHSTAQPNLQPNTLSEEVLEDVSKLFSSDRHEGSLKLLGYLVTPSMFYLCFSHKPFRLKDLICYTPTLLSGSHRPLFIIYQILHYLRWLHSHGLTHDNISSNTLHIDETLWVRVGAPKLGILPLEKNKDNGKNVKFGENVRILENMRINKLEDKEDEVEGKEDVSKIEKDNPLGSIDSFGVKLPDSLFGACKAWIKGYISNLDYLVLLNEYSGSVSGDPNLHPIVPWVTDFSSSYGGWRDLSKSKFRLNKGDFHLDSTYKIHGLRVTAPSSQRSRRSFHEEDAETPVTPHHIIDTLSEITFFSYFARRMPKSLLCKYVRSKWEPQEYPTSLENLYFWTPDECIPEFYTDNTIFTSVHSDLPDLHLPQWAKDSGDFVRKHRAALEGDYVSSKLHCWIDIMFGDKLFGPSAVQNKNVYKELVDNHKTITNKGVRHLFQFPHPQKLLAGPSVPLLPRSTHQNCLAGPPVPLLPQSTHQLLSNKEGLEVCEEPDYDEDQDVNIRRKTYQTPDEEDRISVQTLQRNHSIDPSVFRNFIQKRPISAADDESLGAIQELKFLPVKLNKEEENSISDVKDLNQFFSCLGGSLWEEQLKVSSPATPSSTLVDRQRRDVQAAGCVLIEILSSTQIPECKDLSRERYLQEALFLWSKNKNDVFLYLNDVVDYLLYSDDVFCTTEYLLHPHSSTLAFPPYFYHLYNLLLNLEQREEHENKISYCSTFLSGNVKFLPSLGATGILILLAYLKPLFSGPCACRAFIKLFDTIAVHCNQRSMEVLSDSLEEFYRTSSPGSERMMLANVNFVMSVKRRFGLKAFLGKFVGYIMEDIVNTESYATLQTDTQTVTQLIQPSLLAVECYSTLKQTLPSLGPILTAKYLTSKLLQVLVGCHVYNDVTATRCGGEEIVARFLIDIALVYGEAIIDTQYIPRVFNMVKSAMFRVTNKNEAKLLAALLVVRDSVKCLDGPTLHNMLNDLHTFMFEPIMRLLTSSRILFPHTGSGRLLLCKSISKLLVLIVKHVQYSFIQEPETGKHLVLPLVKQYFQMFDAVSYLYVQDVKSTDDHGVGGTGGGTDHVMSPSSQYSLLDRSQEEDYFKHLKDQFPSYPRRYYSSSEVQPNNSSPGEIDLNEGLDQASSSPVSRELKLSEALQLESEDIVGDTTTQKPDQDERSSWDSIGKTDDGIEDNSSVHISLLPSDNLSQNRPSSLTDPETDSLYREAVPRVTQHPSSSPCSSDEEEEESEEEDAPPDPCSRDLECMSDGSKRERAIQQQIEDCLTPGVAQKAYVALCRLIGQETLRRTLDNIELIEVLAYMDIPNLENSSSTDSPPRPRYVSGGSATPYLYPSPLLTCKPLDQSDTLKDNWRRVWESSVTSTSDDFNFRHIFLQQFKGHSDRINALKVTEDECFLLSASKDKTVTLWDLRASNTGLGTKIKRFEDHCRPVLDLTYLDYRHTVVSMDQHQTLCTDLELQKVVSKYESKNSVVLAPLPDASNRFIQGTSDSTLRTYDTRVRGGVVLEWRVATPLRSVHIIKSLLCDPAGVWVATGFSSGAIHVLDLRVGIVMHAFRPHQQDITGILCGEGGDVYTSSTDSAVSVCHWRRTRAFTEGLPPENKYAGYRDGVTGMCLIEPGDLVTCASYKLTTISPNGNSTTKLRSDIFRGGVSSMAVLPLNRLVVFGCDSGSIRLLA